MERTENSTELDGPQAAKQSQVSIANENILDELELLMGFKIISNLVCYKLLRSVSCSVWLNTEVKQLI